MLVDKAYEQRRIARTNCTTPNHRSSHRSDQETELPLQLALYSALRSKSFNRLKLPALGNALRPAGANYLPLSFLAAPLYGVGLMSPDPSHVQSPLRKNRAYRNDNCSEMCRAMMWEKVGKRKKEENRTTTVLPKRESAQKWEGAFSFNVPSSMAGEFV